MYKHPKTQEEISLEKLLMMLPKELLVEKLNYHILDTPLIDGIRAWRGFEQCMQRAMNDNADMSEVIVFAEPFVNQINLLFDLHEEIENIVDSHDFEAELQIQELEKFRALDKKAGSGK